MSPGGDVAEVGGTETQEDSTGLGRSGHAPVSPRGRPDDISFSYYIDNYDYKVQLSLPPHTTSLPPCDTSLEDSEFE